MKCIEHRAKGVASSSLHITKVGRHKEGSFQAENIPPHEPLDDLFGDIVPMEPKPLCAS